MPDGTAPIQAPIGVVGISHHSAPLAIRSRVRLAGDDVAGFLALAKERGVPECVVLSTCNRVEVYFSGTEPDTARQLLAECSDLTLRELGTHLFEKSCVAVADHLFQVAAGMDSAVLGETEIVAQVKSAWRLASEHGTSGPMLDLLFQRALEAGKRVRSETDLCRNVMSTGSMAVKVAGRRTGGYADTTVVILGAGKIAERIAKDLRRANAASVLILNRTRVRAEDLAAKHGFESDDLAALEARVAQADVVFTTLSAPLPILSGEVLRRIERARGGRPLTIVDLGVPPNADREALCADFELIDLEMLTQECVTNSDRRSAAMPAALEIVDEELLRFGSVLTERAAGPTIRALMARGEAIRRQNLDWARERLEHLGEKELRVVEELAKRMMIGLLRAPIEGLKGELATPEHREVVERLFDITASEAR